MNVLITGSSGFLGQNIAKSLTAQGYTVTGLDSRPGEYTTLVQDVRAGLPTAKYDLVIHLAAEVGGRANIEAHYLNMIANIELDRIVFAWAVKHAKKIIYPSSCAVYPVEHQQSRNTPLAESLVDFDNNCVGVSDHLYGWSKLTAERVLWQIAKDTQLQAAVMRPFSGYGPGQTVDYPMANLINQIRQTPGRAKVWGDGHQTRDFVHVDDIVNTVNWLIQDQAQYRTVNIGTGRSVNFLELADIIHEIIHGTRPRVVEALVGQPVGMKHRQADTALQQQLGILPKIALEDGIRTLV